MNKRKKYVIKEVSIECLGSVRTRLIMSGKLVLSFPRESLALEIVRICNKAHKPVKGQLAVWYELSEVPATVNTKSIHSLSEFISSIS